MNEELTQPMTDAPEATPEQQSIENTDTPAAEPQQQPQSEPEAEQNIHRTNYQNAQRRIRSRTAAQRRIAELEQRLAQYEGRTDTMSKFHAQQLQDRIDDMSAMADDDRMTEFTERAKAELGNGGEALVDQVQPYADYVNANEPDLLNYINRPNGMRLLKAWCDRMDKPALRQQWLGMTRYERNQVLAKFYAQLSQSKPVGNGNVPVPAGGRETASAQPSDDFGVELERARARHRG